MTVPAFLDRLSGVRPSGTGFVALCPAHDDRNPSLSVSEGDDGRVLANCHAGCSPEDVVAALGLTMADLFSEQEGEGGAPPARLVAPLPSSAPVGLTVADYASGKGLPPEFLVGLGLSDMTYQNAPAVRVPYRDIDGGIVSARFRRALQGPERFCWKRGDKPLLYGLDRLGDARSSGHVVLVEGESDAHTLWFHGVPAVGLPGANQWREDRDAAHFAAIPKVFVVIEPDAGGDAVLAWLSRSAIRDRAWLVRLGEQKDVSDLYLSDKDRFGERWEAALANAVSWEGAERVRREQQRAETWAQAKALATRSDILADFASAFHRSGVAGEDRNGKLLYLAVTSRLLGGPTDRPVSVAIKGPSAAGKSFVAQQVLRFFPEDAYHAVTGMSERAMAYSTEPLSHRMLVVYEAAGLAGDFASYLVRSLLSEGRLRYETVEKTRDGLEPKVIEREGPTGLIVTTTNVSLHPENETRLLSLTVADTPEQTRAVMIATANPPDETDVSEWIALQEWLAIKPSEVFIPFADALARKAYDGATRMRRDFYQVLVLIRAHALLHQHSRETDAEGRIVATLNDYAAVRDLAADLVAEGAGASVPETVRQVVEAVAQVRARGHNHATHEQMGEVLGIDRSAAGRRARHAISLGLLTNEETKRGRPARLVVGTPLPDQQQVLPPPDALANWATGQLGSGGADPPPPQPTEPEPSAPAGPVAAPPPPWRQRKEPTPDTQHVKCDDYLAHQTHHVRRDGRFVCELCGDTAEESAS
ncbi:MAG: hypothetical protein H0W81_08835 [Chloroflexi bacterium]|nr:hypothetical protein [Chloroflexota bacterium]